MQIKGGRNHTDQVYVVDTFLGINKGLLDKRIQWEWTCITLAEL